MLLVIPSIEISNGQCVHQVQEASGKLTNFEPIEMAKLWRRENAKMLHITDLDGVKTGTPVNIDVVSQIAKTVDIPIELGGGIRTFDTVKKALEIGVYRVVIGTMLIDKPEIAEQCIDTFGANKVILGIDAKNFRTMIDGGKDSGITSMSVALNAKQLGFRRIIYTDVLTTNEHRIPNFGGLKLLALKTGMRIISSGGISGIEDLLKIQELETLGVDSVIIGKALYENKFPCQMLWRICEAGNYPCTARI